MRVKDQASLGRFWGLLGVLLGLDPLGSLDCGMSLCLQTCTCAQRFKLPDIRVRVLVSTVALVALLGTYSALLCLAIIVITTRDLHSVLFVPAASQRPEPLNPKSVLLSVLSALAFARASGHPAKGAQICRTAETEVRS